jgi:hypothetical protein
MTRAEAISALFLALAVIRAPVQIGRGKKLPHESERRMAAEFIVQHYDLSGVRLFRRPPLQPHGGGFGKPATEKGG